MIQFPKRDSDPVGENWKRALEDNLSELSSESQQLQNEAQVLNQMSSSGLLVLERQSAAFKNYLTQYVKTETQVVPFPQPPLDVPDAGYYIAPLFFELANIDKVVFNVRINAYVEEASPSFYTDATLRIYDSSNFVPGYNEESSFIIPIIDYYSGAYNSGYTQARASSANWSMELTMQQVEEMLPEDGEIYDPVTNTWHPVQYPLRAYVVLGIDPGSAVPSRYYEGQIQAQMLTYPSLFPNLDSEI